MRIAIVALMALTAACQAEQEATAPAPPPEIAPMTGAIVLQGDAWQLHIDPAVNTMLMQRAAGADVRAAYAAPQATGTGYTIASDPFNVMLETQACTWNGANYPMRATVQVSGRTFTGCAAERWDAYLMRYMAEIDACIRQAPNMRYVTYAGDSGAGSVVVRLRGMSGQQDCHVRDGAVEFYPREAAIVAPTEYEATFVRANFDGSGSNPGGECYQAREVRGADGVLLGWMDDPQGC